VPPRQCGEQSPVPVTVDGSPSPRPVSELLGKQIVLDAGRDRTEHQLVGQVGDRGGEPGALDLPVPDLTEPPRGTRSG